jgi:dynein heavy chain
MKFRVCGKKLHADSSTVQDLKPFFEVDVQLADKEIILKPSLDEIQKSINKAATAVLRCSKNLYHWD